MNLIAGFLAVKLHYPSLYNVHASFSEYAVPLPFHWALYLEETQACSLAQTLAAEILKDYPFDSGYEKSIELRFNPEPESLNLNPYPLGEISLNEKHKDDAGLFACYLKFKQ